MITIISASQQIARWVADTSRMHHSSVNLRKGRNTNDHTRAELFVSTGWAGAVEGTSAMPMPGAASSNCWASAGTAR